MVNGRIWAKLIYAPCRTVMRAFAAIYNLYKDIILTTAGASEIVQFSKHFSPGQTYLTPYRASGH
jgi:hypothetical protein